MVLGQLDKFDTLFTGAFIVGQRPTLNSNRCRRLTLPLPFCERPVSPQDFLATAMTRIIQGVLDFQKRIFRQKRELFHELSKGQSPLGLFITCSDSRINPNLLTQTEPGELFILRNAGNLVPPPGMAPSGEDATIEYAVAHLKVREIFLCGHSKCGAMHGLLHPEALESLPRTRQWLGFAQEVLAQVQQGGQAQAPETLLNRLIERNVLFQLERLKTHPAVGQALAAGRLRLHAWVYHIETGKVEAHDPKSDQFVPLAVTPRPARVPVAVPESPRDEWETYI